MDETKKKLLAAQSVEEAAQILKDAGDNETTAEKAWEEVCRMREHDGDALSLDELDAVAGGMGCRNWYQDGCAATVEIGSDCDAVDGGCFMFFNNYEFGPVDQPCVYCGARYTSPSSETFDGYTGWVQTYCCRICGKEFFLNKSGEWEEVIRNIPW